MSDNLLKVGNGKVAPVRGSESEVIDLGHRRKRIADRANELWEGHGFRQEAKAKALFIDEDEYDVARLLWKGYTGRDYNPLVNNHSALLEIYNLVVHGTEIKNNG